MQNHQVTLYSNECVASSLRSSLRPEGSKATILGGDNGVSMVVINIDVIDADLGNVPVSGVGVHATVPILAGGKYPDSGLLRRICLDGSTIHDPLREPLPPAGAVKRPHEGGAVAAADQRDVAPHDAVDVDGELEPRGEGLGRALEVPGVDAARDAALEAVGHRHELRRLGRDPDVLVRHGVAVVVVDVEPAPVRPVVRDLDPALPVVRVPPREGRLRRAVPSLRQCRCCGAVVHAVRVRHRVGGVALECRRVH